MTLTYDTWSENKDRPVWVRGHRDELDQLVSEPVPDSVAAVPAWVERYDSTVSKHLKQQEGDDES